MKLWKLVMPILILAVAATAAAIMVRGRQPVERHETPAMAPLVRVMTVEEQDRALAVSTQGTVMPRTEATLVAQVAGEITATSRAFVTGGFFGAGDELVRLDRRDHELAALRARAEVAQVALRMAQEEAEARLATEEWQALGEAGEPDPLVLRAPQLAQLRAAKQAAEAAVRQADLAVERTVIRAPYAGRIRAVHASRGHYVTPGTPLATVHPTDYAEVRLPVPVADLAFLDVRLTPREAAPRSGASGPAVTLRAPFAGRERTWLGRIVRSEGELDPRTRMLTLVARVDDPYGRRSAGADHENDDAPLPVGLFVDASIAGRQAEGVIVLPREALRQRKMDGQRSADDEGEVLLVDDDDRLRFRTVEVLRIAGDEAIVRSGLQSGERVVTGDLPIAVDGMAVRPVSEDPS